MTIRFGEHKGKNITDESVPVTLLQWIEEKFDLRVTEREELNHEIERRQGDRPGAGRVVRQDKGERMKVPGKAQIHKDK